MIDNEKEYILCSAIKRKEPRDCGEYPPYHPGLNDILEIELGFRHHDIMRRFHDEIDLDPEAQGFYTSYGRFVDRTEGMKIAVECGQVSVKYGTINGRYRELFSEDLYLPELKNRVKKES